MSGHTSAGRTHCQNCGQPLTGPFCANCGQHDIDYHRSLGPIIEDSLEGFLHFDGKFFRSVRWLFTRPGFLTQEFIAGRRVAYTHPLRLYIFASFLYFASSLFLTPQPTQVEVAQASAEAQKEKAEEPATGPKGPVKYPAFAKIMERIKHENHEEVGKEIDHLIPTMAFFCLPLLATAVMLAYSKSGRVYVEHLIFALHIQAFYFLAALATKVAQALFRLAFVPLADLTGLFAFLGGAFLIYRAFLAVYGEGRWKTFFKASLVGLLYGLVLIAALFVTAIASFLVVLSSAPAVH